MFDVERRGQGFLHQDLDFYLDMENVTSYAKNMSYFRAIRFVSRAKDSGAKRDAR